MSVLKLSNWSLKRISFSLRGRLNYIFIRKIISCLQTVLRVPVTRYLSSIKIGVPVAANSDVTNNNLLLHDNLDSRSSFMYGYNNRTTISR